MELATSDWNEKVSEFAMKAARAQDHADMIAVMSSLELHDGELWFMGAPIGNMEPARRLDVRTAILALVDRLSKMKSSIDQSIALTMSIENAPALYHPDYDVTYESPKPKPTVNEEMLYNGVMKLAREGVIPEDQAKKAVSTETTTTFSANMTSFKPLLKFGTKVTALFKAAVLDDKVPGPAVLSIKPKKK